ncbi:MAG: glycosyltransferase family 2 protein [Lachnospiraceae bacterium]|nr:glycosyltransferase family 2 protein [Lachnospiraceae bacterium]
MSNKHFVSRQIQRLRNCGSVKGVARKVKQKIRQSKSMRCFGTASFPSEEKRRLQSETAFDKSIKISILVPLFNTPKVFLTEMIDSVINQTYGNWDLCLADGSDEEHRLVGEICREYAEKDNRIVYKKLESNEGISGNTNRCFELATGDYIGLFDHDDILHPEVLFEYVKAINEKNADFLYCDEVTFKGSSINNMITANFKPDFAIDNLRANNYICHFSCFKKDLLERMELFRSEFDGSQDHDMILRITEKAENIVHIPRILYYWRSHSGSVASNVYVKEYAIDAAIRAVTDHLNRCGYEGAKVCSTDEFPTHYKIGYKINGNPKISIIIPNMNHTSDLKRCIDSIRDKSSYDNFEIVIVENNSTDKEIFEYYDELTKDSRVTVVRYEGEFNYSSVNNYGAEKASGDYYILLNNDTEIITTDWIEQLLMYAQRSDVGAVGAKLLYEDGSIQHAGVILGLGPDRVAGHIFYQMPGSAIGYMGRLTYAQNLSAVTGACLMVSKKCFEEVGGLDESFRVCLNDVDFCLKLREKGYLNVFTPFAKLYHYESKSRGFDESPEKQARFQAETKLFKEKWGQVLEAGDPYYNPNLSLDYPDCRVKI